MALGGATADVPTNAIGVPPLRDDGGFDPSRIKLLPRGDKILAMDRMSGRWALLPEDQRGLLVLLGAAKAEHLPDQLGHIIGELQENLIRQGIGVAGPSRDFSALTTIIVKLTNACNMACAYCYDFESSEKARRLETEIAVKAVREAIDLCEGRLWVILHGGEPMLVWDLIETLVIQARAHAAERGVAIQFTGQTNMTRLTDRIVSFSIRHDIAWGVSVDGTAETHDRLRVLHTGGGTHGLFRDALNRYPAFVRSSSVMSTVTAVNQGRLLECACYFRDLGMAGWDWSLFQPIGRARGESRLAIDVDVLIAAWNVLFDAVLSGEFHGFPVMPVKKYIDNFLNGPGKNMCMRPQCGAARDLVSISSDGTIEACDCIDPKGPLGNLGNLATGTIAGARVCAKAAKIRARDVQHKECGKCIWFGVCGGTCLAHAGDVEEVWPEGCAVALNAFDRVSAALASGEKIQSYFASLDT